MKIFVNKKTKLTHEVDGKSTNMLYSDMLMLGLNTPPEKGWTVIEMDKCIKLIDKLKAFKGEEEISLEDAEFEMSYVKIPTNWTMMHVDIVTFQTDMDAVKNS